MHPSIVSIDLFKQNNKPITKKCPKSDMRGNSLRKEIESNDKSSYWNTTCD